MKRPSFYHLEEYVAIGKASKKKYQFPPAFPREGVNLHTEGKLQLPIQYLWIQNLYEVVIYFSIMYFNFIRILLLTLKVRKS